MYANGDKYEGQFSNDRLHGFGVYTWPDKRRWEGPFKNGRMHGIGVQICPDGASVEQEYYKGERVMSS